MILNYIWIAFFIIAFVVAIIKLIFFCNTEVFPAIMNSTFKSAETAFTISLGLTGGALLVGHSTTGSIFMNITAKMLGLDNAPLQWSAAPCGLIEDLAGSIAAIFICYLFFG